MTTLFAKNRGCCRDVVGMDLEISTIYRYWMSRLWFGGITMTNWQETSGDPLMNIMSIMEKLTDR